MKNKLILLYPCLLLIYSVYSYSQTAPNLVLSSNQYFWKFQQTMWQLGYHARSISSMIYGALIIGFFGLYFLIIQQIQKKLISLKQLAIIFSLCIAALLPSYPALSNDIYNYLMNAKMMHVYGASPYVHAAWDFPNDPWLKFMMNVHTTTPYGYVWTGLGYLVYGLTLGDLQFGMIGFRGLAIVATGVCAWAIWKLSKKNLVAVGLFCLNPLILLEAVNNAHNDITMMAFFMAGLAINSTLVLVILWLASVLTKLITIISPVVYTGYYVAKKRLVQFGLNFYDLLAVALVAVMVTDGAKRFFSWYLLWSIPVAVLAKHRLTRLFVISLSFGGLLSYLPYLYTGEYTANLGYIRYLLFFVPGFVAVGISLINHLLKKAYENR